MVGGIVQDKEGCRIATQAVRRDLHDASFVAGYNLKFFRITKIINTIDRFIDAEFKVSVRGVGFLYWSDYFSVLGL